MHFGIFFLCLFFLSGFATAQSSIDIVFDRTFVLNNQEFYVALLTKNLDKCQFRVRPFIEHGLIEIFNFESSVWVAGDDQWSNMPSACGEVKLKISAASVARNLVGFYIQNRYSGTVIKTATKYIWNYKLNSNYLNVVKLYNFTTAINSIKEKFPVLIDINGKIHR